MRLASAGAIFSFLLLIGVYILTHQVSLPAVGGDYTEGLVGEPQFLNPLYASASAVDADLTRLLFRGLFIFDSASGLIGDLAKSYTVEEDGKAYVVNLRENTLWHDGEALNAQDVVFTFQAIANPEYLSPLSVTFRSVKVEAVDDLTVRFTLSEPFAPFLSTLTVGILPAHIWEGILPRRASLVNLNTQPVGNGPYRFEKFTKDQNGSIRSYTLQRFPAFYGNRPSLERITFKFYDNLNALVSALEGRQVEGAAFLPQESARKLDGRAIRLLRPTIPQQINIFFNQTTQPALKELAVRQALDLAVNRKAIVENVYGGFAKALSGPIVADTFLPASTPTEQNLEEARTKLDTAKWAVDETTGVRAKNIDEDAEAELLEIELVYPDTADFATLAALLKDLWQEIGVRVTIRAVQPAELGSAVIKPRAYQMLLTGILYGVDPDPFPFWHSSQAADPGVNLPGYANRKVDDALETARASSDAQKRTEAYTIVETSIKEDLPALFLVQPDYLYATAAKIKGNDLPRITTPADRFNRVEGWFVRTKRVFRPGLLTKNGF